MNQAAEKERELEELFREDPKTAFELLHEEYRDYIARYIKWCAPGVPNSELPDLYQETMAGMWKAVQEPSFNPERPLRLVQTIAKRRAYDYVRKKRPSFTLDLNAIRQHVEDDLQGTGVDRRWRYLDPMLKREFRQVLVEEIEKLPDKQRTAAYIFVDLYEQIRTRDVFGPLAEEIRRTTGEDVTVAAAKSRWHAARQKIAEGLRRRGFGFVPGE